MWSKGSNAIFYTFKLVLHNMTNVRDIQKLLGRKLYLNILQNIDHEKAKMELKFYRFYNFRLCYQKILNLNCNGRPH